MGLQILWKSLVLMRIPDLVDLKGLVKNGLGAGPFGDV